jgi:anti-sigma-K factor RskA
MLAAAAALLVVVGGAVVITSTNSGSNDPIAAVVDADDAVTRRLDGELGPALTVVYSPEAAALVIAGDDVPTMSDDQTYQLWLIDSSGARSVGVFEPDQAGRVEVRFDDTDPSGLVLGVTREPAGGSQQPTLPILASA